MATIAKIHSTESDATSRSLHEIMNSEEQLFRGMSGWAAVLVSLAESGNDISKAVIKVGLAMTDEEASASAAGSRSAMESATEPASARGTTDRVGVAARRGARSDGGQHAGGHCRP